jgi:hypothetical protein
VAEARNVERPIAIINQSLRGEELFDQTKIKALVNKKKKMYRGSDRPDSEIHISPAWVEASRTAINPPRRPANRTAMLYVTAKEPTRNKLLTTTGTSTSDVG